MENSLTDSQNMQAMRTLVMDLINDRARSDQSICNMTGYSPWVVRKVTQELHLNGAVAWYNGTWIPKWKYNKIHKIKNKKA